MSVQRFPGREKGTVAEAHRAATRAAGGGCDPFEAGILGRLADNECKAHGRLPADTWAPPCGCWPGEEQSYRSRMRAKARREAA